MLPAPPSHLAPHAGESSLHSRVPSSPAVSLRELHIAVQQEDDSLLPSAGETFAAAAAHSRSARPSLSSSYTSYESITDGPSPLPHLLPVSVPSPLPSSPPSPSGTASSTAAFFASLEQQKREIAHERGGRSQRHRHSLLASLPPPPPPPQPLPSLPADSPVSDAVLPTAPQPPLAPRRRELSHHQTVLPSRYCSSLLAARAADVACPVLFCVLNRRIAAEGDNFLLYSFPSSSALPLHLLALIHTFAIVNDAADAVTAQSVRRLLLAGDSSRQQRDVVVSVQEDDDRLYVLALTGVGQSERRQWEVRVEPLLFTLRQVMCALYGQPHSHWFDPQLSSRQSHKEAGRVDPNGPVTVPSVPASSGSFVSSLLILASSYYSLSLLDPLLRLFCRRLYSHPSPELSLTPLCGMVAARTMQAEEEAVWRAALTRVQADHNGVDSPVSQSTSTAFAIDCIVLYHHRALLTPTTRSFSHTLFPQLLATVTAILALNGWLSSASVPSSTALHSRVFRIQLPCSLKQVDSSDGGEQAILSVLAQGEWWATALLLSRPSRSFSPAAVVPLSAMSDPYHIEPLRALKAALVSVATRPTISSAHRPPALCYSFSVSPSPVVILHPDRPSLCPALHTAGSRLHTSLLSSCGPFLADVSPAADSTASDSAVHQSVHASLSASLLHELAVTAQDELGRRYWLRGRWRQSAVGAVLLCEQNEAAAGAEQRTKEDEAAGEKRCDDGMAAAQHEWTDGGGGEESSPSARAERLFARGWQLLATISAAGTTK